MAQTFYINPGSVVLLTFDEDIEADMAFGLCELLEAEVEGISFIPTIGLRDINVFTVSEPYPDVAPTSEFDPA